MAERLAGEITRDPAEQSLVVPGTAATEDGLRARGGLRNRPIGVKEFCCASLLGGELGGRGRGCPLPPQR
jgi:hypothetical protein